jgi:hypothetical protein
MNPNPSIMKSIYFSRTLLVAAALLFSILSCFGQNDPAEQVVGTWLKVVDVNKITMTLTDDNKTEVEFTGDDVIDVYGSYKVSGAQITLTDEGGDYSSGTSGIYEFKLNDNKMTLTIVDDPVNGRSMLVQGTWTLAPEAEK